MTAEMTVHELVMLPLTPEERARERAADERYMAYMTEVDRVREWIRHMDEPTAFELAREVMEKAAPDPFVILLSLPHDSLIWLAENYGPAKPPAKQVTVTRHANGSISSPWGVDEP